MRVLKWGFGGNLHKVKQGTSSLSTLSTQDTGDDGGQPIHNLE